MKLSSNLIIDLVLAIAGILLMFAFGRIVLSLTPLTETKIELEENFESRQLSSDRLKNESP
ncbi:MAG: hypothetical protein QNJ72_21885 [Pleurocapsa sp. MO_226.B13]|nr:hypothetical protein [Pleurocapsa sp. MO_226.B13]